MTKTILKAENMENERYLADLWKVGCQTMK